MIKKKKIKKRATVTDKLLSRADRILAGTDAAPEDLTIEYSILAAGYRSLLNKFHKTISISDSYQYRLKEFTIKLEEEAIKYRKLKEVALPICTHCKQVRSDSAYWEKLETFFSTQADMMISHGICPDCVTRTRMQLGLVDGTEPVSKKKTADYPFAPSGDDDQKHMKTLLEKCVEQNNPLAPELERIIAQYDKLQRRFSKTVSISDGYQSQLMDIMARLEITARTDLLTGLPNRWEIMSRLHAEAGRSDRHGTDFSILLADLDHFKILNDTYGHMAGDRILKAIAKSLRSAIRVEDFCGRWGGEEFLIILPETELDHAALVAEKLVSAIRNTPLKLDGKKIYITISIGAGTFRSGMDIDGCINKVDEALYRAKNSGRNCVMTTEI